MNASMAGKGVISKVTQPIEWMNSLMIMYKPNNKGIRIYLDPQDLNCALKCKHYRSKTLEGVTAKLTTAKYFEHFDCGSGFWMIKLHNLTVLIIFNIPFGKYNFHRFPFDLHTSKDIFLT